MIFKEIEADGNFYLPAFGEDDTRRVLTVRELTNIQIESNDDDATVTIGYEGSDETFKAYHDGDITSDGGAVITHGIGARLMVNVSGITANSVFLAYSSS